jgi:hypothetical protein
MTLSRLLAGVVAALATTAASAQDASPKLPDYAKTPAELSAVQSTGGAGGSGNAKVQVVTILGDASKPGPYAQLLKVGANAQIAALVTGSGPCSRALGTSAMARSSTRPS